LLETLPTPFPAAADFFTPDSRTLFPALSKGQGNAELVTLQHDSHKKEDDMAYQQAPRMGPIQENFERK
jgi:hypothetical protein